MPAPLSIIIPTLNPGAGLGALVASLIEGLDAGLVAELILSDGGSAQDLAELASDLGAVLVTGGAGRGRQMQRGAAKAKGRWLLFLHADTCLQPGWSQTVIAHLHQNSDHAGYFRLKFDASGVRPALVAFWANLRSRLLGLPYGDQGLLIPRRLYDDIGGYQAIPLMEDVAMSRALRGRLTGLNGVAVTSAAKYQQQGWLRRSLRNSWTLARYFAGIDPEKLARQYRRHD